MENNYHVQEELILWRPSDRTCCNCKNMYATDKTIYTDKVEYRCNYQKQFIKMNGICDIGIEQFKKRRSLTLQEMWMERIKEQP